MTPLVRLYDGLRIPNGDRGVLSTKYGVDSIGSLVGKESQLINNAKKDLSSYTCWILLNFAILYIKEQKRRQAQLESETVESLFTCRLTSDQCWKHILAIAVMEDTELQLHSDARKKARTEIAEIESNDGDVPACIVPCPDIAHDGIAVDEKTLCHKLGIDGDNSPWILDASRMEVVLASHASAVRFPVTLFQGLHPHQKTGFIWLAKWVFDDTGGILGE